MKVSFAANSPSAIVSYPLVLLSVSTPDCLDPLTDFPACDFADLAGALVGFLDSDIVGFGSFCAFVMDSSRLLM